MFGSFFNSLTRRQVLGRGSWLALPWFLSRSAAAPPDVYRSIGVRPLINCRGTLTVIGGSLELPQVRAAKDAAAR